MKISSTSIIRRKRYLSWNKSSACENMANTYIFLIPFHAHTALVRIPPKLLISYYTWICAPQACSTFSQFMSLYRSNVIFFKEDYMVFYGVKGLSTLHNNCVIENKNVNRTVRTSEWAAFSWRISLLNPKLDQVSGLPSLGGSACSVLSSIKWVGCLLFADQPAQS